MVWEGSLGKLSYCRQPDSGNPTVRDERGAEQKRGQWWNCEPAAQIERVRVGNPPPKVVRAALLPDSQFNNINTGWKNIYFRCTIKLSWPLPTLNLIQHA